MDRLELDHVFVCSPRAQQDQALLQSAGLRCGVNRIHAGQGTANANFYFDNAYLELLWLHLEEEVRSEVVSPLALWERIHWRVTGACPFGIAFRTDVAEQPAWHYAAPFFPPGLAIPILTRPNRSKEPLVFVSPGAVKPVSPEAHAGRHRSLRRVHIQMPGVIISQEMRRVADTGLVTLEPGDSPHMDLEFEGASETLDFSPDLPLTLRW